MEKKQKSLGSIFLENFSESEKPKNVASQNKSFEKPNLIEQAQPKDPKLSQFKQGLLSNLAQGGLGQNQAQGE